MSDFNVETKCLHSCYTPSKGEPCALPICQSTTYKYDTTDEMGQLFDLKAEGYFYTRLQNPTNDAVAAKIADLEGGVAAILTSSGQSGITSGNWYLTCWYWSGQSRHPTVS